MERRKDQVRIPDFAWEKVKNGLCGMRPMLTNANVEVFTINWFNYIGGIWGPRHPILDIGKKYGLR